MQNQREILETVRMIEQQHLDIRTITMGISLYDCADADPKAACRKIYDKVTRMAGQLVRTGEAIETEYGIPIVNKRVAVTPVAEVAAASATVDYVNRSGVARMAWAKRVAAGVPVFDACAVQFMPSRLRMGSANAMSSRPLIMRPTIYAALLRKKGWRITEN